MRLLPASCRRRSMQLPIPRRMRWGAGEALFVRPVHWLVMLFGKDVVPATLLDTAGRPHHARPSLPCAAAPAHQRPRPPTSARCASAATCSPTSPLRRERIRAAVDARWPQALNGRALIGAELLDEVTALVEWPVALAGRFEERFLSLPREVLICDAPGSPALLPGRGRDRRAAAAFITVSNIESREPDKVREGNERVVRPRLADAAFFWEQDRKQPLAARRAGARCGHLPGEARLARRQDAPRARARRRDRRRPSGAALDATERAAELCQVRSAHRHGRRVPRAAGGHGHATTRSPTASRRRSPTPSASTTCRAAPAMRCR